MGSGRSVALDSRARHDQLTGGSSRDIYSRLSHPAAEPSEFLFDRCLFNLFIETDGYDYKMLEPEVCNLFAARSKDPIWKKVIELKIKGDVEGIFEHLCDEGCFIEGCEWRGQCGETVFHILFLLNGPGPLSTPLMQVAQKVHAKNPWFLNTPYGPGVYEGEVALHLAVANNNAETVRWLLDQKATLEHNAIGSFFPRFLWGEHPLAWAACAKKVEVLEMLLEYKADIHHRDSMKNTILHNMALSAEIFAPDNFQTVFDVLKSHDPTFVTQIGSFNDEDRTPLQVASAHHHGNFQAMFEVLQAVQWRFGEVLCTNHLLQGWDSAHSRQFQLHQGDGGQELIEKGQEEVSALEVAVLEGNAQFFCVPLNQLMLKAKWTLFVRREFMVRAVSFFGFVIISTASACVHDGYSIAMILRLWSFFLASFFLVYHSYTIVRVQKTVFFRSTRRLADKVSLLDLQKIAVCVLMLLCMFIQTYLDTQTKGTGNHRIVSCLLYGYLMPVTLLIAWACTAELLLLDEYLSNVLILVMDILGTEIPTWVLLQSLLLSAFSAAIYIATAKTYNEQQESMSVFGSYLETVVSLALVPLGGIADVTELMASEHDFVVCLLYFAYSAFSCVLFLNLTISLFTQRTYDIWNNKAMYYYQYIAMLIIADEKRRRPEELRKYWIGSKLGDGRHYLLVQKFEKPEEPPE